MTNFDPPIVDDAVNSVHSLLSDILPPDDDLRLDLLNDADPRTVLVGLDLLNDDNLHCLHTIGIQNEEVSRSAIQSEDPVSNLDRMEANTCISMHTLLESQDCQGFYKACKVFDHNNLKRKSPELTREQLEKKRSYDKAYRERSKRGKIQMNEENEHLKRDNMSLKTENVSMKTTTQDLERENKRLKIGYSELKNKYHSQEARIDALSESLARSRNADLQHENAVLRDQLKGMTQNANPNDLILENSKLRKRIAEVEYRNTVLEMTNEALSMKLVNDKDRRLWTDESKENPH